jgi:hypothetical protein
MLHLRMLPSASLVARIPLPGATRKKSENPLEQLGKLAVLVYAGFLSLRLCSEESRRSFVRGPDGPG